MKQMKHRKIFLSFLLALALVLGLVPGMSLTAYAATTWSESFTSNGGTFNDGVSISANITVTINEGKTLTINDGLSTGGNTLTVAARVRWSLRAKRVQMVAVKMAKVAKVTLVSRANLS